MASYYDDRSFDEIFPLGLPVGESKPNITVFYQKGEQKFAWHETEALAVLRGNIYPNFCLQDFDSWIMSSNKLAKFTSPDILVGHYHVKSWNTAINACQMESERLFLLDYLQKFAVPYEKNIKKINGKPKFQWHISPKDLQDKVPALVPQVWIKWDNQSVKYLNRMGYDATSPYRVDFAAFWNNKVYIILLDGIQHYAKQQSGRWDADEQAYAARLKEDRLLRLQGWEVFRVGNWEVKDDLRRQQVLEELREFIDFPTPPTSLRKMSATVDDEDLPF